MSEPSRKQTWDLWFPAAGATGLSFARTVVLAEAAGQTVLVHAAPPQLEVSVREESGRVLAQGKGLERTAPGPISFLHLDGDDVRLEDRWPEQSDLGRLVILPGGESGVLTAWWHAHDRSAWRWSVEFSNQQDG